MALTTFSPNTLIKSSEVNANFSGLSDGSNDATSNSLETFRSENVYDHIVSGGVITADSAGVNKNASMTALVSVITGKRATSVAVTARVYTASKDTYVDQDNTGALTYTEVANNAASPALVANNIRIAIVVTGATFIAAAASINQGQEDRVLPIASSIPYAVTDSLGNLIANRTTAPGTIGFRRITSNFTTTSVTQVDITGLSTVVNVPTGGRRLKITGWVSNLANSNAAASIMRMGLMEDGVLIAQCVNVLQVNGGISFTVIASKVATAGVHTYKLQVSDDSAGTTTLSASATAPAFILVEPI